MPNTHGFDIVAELAPAALLNIMHAAWETTDLFPKNISLSPGPIDGFNIQGGQVQVPKSGLGVQLVPKDSVALQFELQIQIQLLNPPVPSARNIDIVANASATVPIGPIPGQKDVALLLGGITPDKIGVTLVGGDPIAAKLHDYITEFVHEQYKSNGPAFPHHVPKPNQPILSFTYDAMVDLMDDPSDPAHQIQVTFPMNGTQQQLQISIPIHLGIYNIRPPGAPINGPLGVEAQLVLTADLTAIPGSVSANLNMAKVTVQNLVPAGPIYGVEGPNYMPYAGLLGPILQSQLEQQGKDMVQQMNPISYTYPDSSKIQGFIVQQILQKLNAKGPFEIWPGTAIPPVAVNDVADIVLPDALVIALNPNPGSDINPLTNFVPAGKSFAIAVSGQRTMSMVNASIAAQFPTFPVVIPNVHGHSVRLKSLNPSLTNAIHFSGDLTVINAILGHWDVDASYDVDVGLEWLPPDIAGLQKLKANTGEPDVDLSGLAWLVSILTGFLTFGVTGVVIAIVVVAIVEDVTSSIGSDVVKDQVTNAILGLRAWPSPLQSVGEVKSAFENPIIISSDGLLFGG
jgi:hypothetical protein